jgi:hypothetical protein
VAGLLAAAAFAVVPAANAQAPGGMPPGGLPEKTYMTKNTFSLPVIVDERARAGMREIQLWVKEGPSTPWVMKASVGPNEKAFPYRLNQDGEYWFNVVTVDLQGRPTPADVTREAPGVIVVLDTTKPQVDLKALPPCPDGVVVQCEVQDASPCQVRFEYQTRDHVWRVLEPMADQPGCYCIPKQAVLTGQVKVSCTDRAMNLTEREFSLAALTPAASNVAQAPSQAPAQAQPAQTPLTQAAYNKAETANYPPAGASGNTMPVVGSAKGMASQPKELPSLNEGPVLNPNADKGVQQAVSQEAVKAHPTPADFQVPAPANADVQAMKGCPKWHMTNNPRVSLEYRIEDEGASGVGKVVVYVTRDNGRTWDVLCDDPDRKSPVEFTLPGEGVYGLKLVVSNGRGFGAEAPRSGDAPDYVIELDTTKPHAELLSVKLGPPAESACIDISWMAADKNFGPEPIDLYYSVNQHGPWTPIAKGVPNTGKYRWFLPQEIGKEAFVRLVATDQAGNSCRCEIGEPVALDDSSRPHAVISGIRGN